MKVEVFLFLCAMADVGLAFSPSRVSCEKAVTCDYKLKSDPEAKSEALRCRPTDGYSDSCTEGYCCISMPASVPCNSVWAKVSCGSDGFKAGPPKCDLNNSGSARSCSAGVCCNQGSAVKTCDQAVKCLWGYNPDPNVAGVKRCTDGKGSNKCDTSNCCAPAPSVVSCSEIEGLCDHYARDSSTGSVKRCEPESSASNKCSEDYCCADDDEDDYLEKRKLAQQQQEKETKINDPNGKADD